MAERTGITWADATFNPWIGCTKVGPACEHCYAEAQDARKRWGGETHWGPGVPRRRTSPGNWAQPVRWDKARRAGDPDAPLWVFCASLADVFDNEVDPAWRADLWDLMARTPALRWIVVTKRIGNAVRMLPAGWGEGLPNVGLVSTVVTQEEADRDVPKLLTTPARWRGLSVEPMLGPLSISCLYSPTVVDGPDGRPLLCPVEGGRPIVSRGMHVPREEAYRLQAHAPPMLDWVICGGESGPEARPLDPLWPADLRDECAALGVPFHFKQWGEWAPAAAGARGAKLHAYRRQGRADDGVVRYMARIGVKSAGRGLDGAVHDARPAVYDRVAA